MNKFLSIFLLLLIVLASGQTLAQADDEFSSFEERMTGGEFTSAGLHKLSQEELAALNEWVRQRSLGEAEITALQQAQNPDVTDMRLMEEETFTSSIVGSFNGWKGGTTFELANGMVWEQTGADSFGMRQMENPVVTIRPGFWDSWTLQVDGYNKRTKVRRIK